MPGDVRSDAISYVIGDDRPVAWDLAEHDGDALAAGGFSAYCQVRDHPLPHGQLLQAWSTDDGDDASPARIYNRGGTVGWVVELDVTDSRSWTWRRGGFDLFLVDPDGRAAPISADSTWVNYPAHTAIPDYSTVPRRRGTP